MKMFKLKIISIILFVFLFSSMASAADNKLRDKNSHELKVSAVSIEHIHGAGIELGHNFNSMFFIGIKSTKASEVIWDASSDNESSKTKHDRKSSKSKDPHYKLKLSTQIAYLRFTPFESSGFNLRAGVVSRDWSAKGIQKDKFGSNAFKTLYDVEVVWPKQAGMLGFGWSWQTEGRFLWGFGVEAISGGEPEVKITLNKAAALVITQAEIEAQENKIKDKADRFKTVATAFIDIGVAF